MGIPFLETPFKFLAGFGKGLFGKEAFETAAGSISKGFVGGLEPKVVGAARSVGGAWSSFANYGRTGTGALSWAHLGAETAGTAAWMGVQAVGYNAAASYLDRYADNENLNPGTRGVVGLAQMALRYKSFQGPLKSAVGFMGRSAQGMALHGSLDRSSAWYQFMGPGGHVPNFIAGGDVSSLAGRGLGLGIRYGGKSFVNAYKGAGEYGRFAKAAAGGKGWLGAMMAIEHPLTLPTMVGLAAGAHSAYLNRETYPMLHGDLSPQHNSAWPVNAENFGRGIDFGNSVMTSSDVMGGQSAVTMKMLRRRAV